MNPRILISLSVIGAVAALAIGGTVAYFSDTETSSGNTFTAGTIDLTLTESDGAPINLTNMAPGDSASGTITVTNAGSLPGSLYATAWYDTADATTSNTDPNMSDDYVAKQLLITAFTADNVDILSQIPDVDNDDRKTVYDLVNDPNGMTLPGYPSPGELETWYSYDANMTVGESHVYTMTIKFDPNAGNEYQGDGITLTFQFLLTQQGIQ